MSIGFSVKMNSVSPDMAKRLSKVIDRRPILTAMAETAVQTTKQAFYNPTLRPLPWPDKADGTPATLRWKQMLRRSPATKSVSNTAVIIGSDRKYAAIHQLCGKVTIPARKRKVRLQQTTGGGLKRQANFKNLAVFAKKRHKNVREMEVDVEEHSFNMPARPFFPFGATGKPTKLLIKRLDDVVFRKTK